MLTAPEQMLRLPRTRLRPRRHPNNRPTHHRRVICYSRPRTPLSTEHRVGYASQGVRVGWPAYECRAGSGTAE